MTDIRIFTEMSPEIEKIAGAKEVIEAGGVVALVRCDLNPETGRKWSTTDIIAKIRGEPK